MWLCLFAYMHLEEYSKSKLNSDSCFKIFGSTGILWYPTIIPLFRGISSICLHQGWEYIYSKLNLLTGSTFKIFSSKSRNYGETNEGRTYSPDNIFLYSWEVLLSSNGKYPQTIANKITPQLQISTWSPWYFLLAIISGAA